MAISIDSKLGDILKTPEAVAILEELRPGVTDNPALSLITKIPLRVILTFPDAHCTPELAKEIEERLAALNL